MVSFRVSSFMECLEMREIKVHVLAPHCKQNEKFQCVSVERQKRWFSMLNCYMSHFTPTRNKEGKNIYFHDMDSGHILSVRTTYSRQAGARPNRGGEAACGLRNPLSRAPLFWWGWLELLPNSPRKATRKWVWLIWTYSHLHLCLFSAMLTHEMFFVLSSAICKLLHTSKMYKQCISWCPEYIANFRFSVLLRYNSWVENTLWT